MLDEENEDFLNIINLVKKIKELGVKVIIFKLVGFVYNKN